MSSSIAIPTQVQTELAAEAVQTTNALSKLDAFEIRNNEDYTFAVDLLKAAKERWKALEEKRKAVTVPLHTALKEIQSWFKPVQDPLVRAEALLKGKIGQYTLQLRAAQEAAMHAAANAAAAGQLAAAAQLVAETAPIATQGLIVKATYDYEIVDEKAVPEQFWSIDPFLIRDFMDQFKPMQPPDVPGLRFFPIGKVTVRP